MKKALSIILCLAMLVSTVPMSVFAAPAAVTTEDSAYESVSGEAELSAEDTYTISFRAGRNSRLKATYSEHYSDMSGTLNQSVTIRNNPATRYESTKDGYKINGWTDGYNVIPVRSSYTVTGDVVLTPNVVPDGAAYEVTFSIDSDLADYYTGPGRIFVAVGETLDLTTNEFKLTSPVGYTALGWENEATDTVVTSVSGTEGQVFSLVAKYDQKTGIVVNSAAKAEELDAGSSEAVFDSTVPGLKVTPADNNPGVVFDALALNAQDYPFVDVTYVKTDAITTSNGGEVYFKLSDDADFDAAKVATGVKKSETETLVTYRYDLSANDAWAGTCSAIRVEPYDGIAAFTITEIKFVENVVVSEIEITNLDSPAISTVPDVNADVPADAAYSIESITWTPDDDYFMGSTEYTATIKVKMNEKGYVFAEDAAVTVGDEEADCVIERTSAVITKAFAAIEAPHVIDIEYNGATSITENNGKLVLSANIVPEIEGDVILPDTITWSITGGAKYATLEGNVLSAMWNTPEGECVVVTATPAYDPSQKKDIEITITGQEGFEVYYEKNTGDTVTGMPFEDDCDMAKANYAVSTVVPTRTGYYFEGWMLDPDGSATVGATLDVTENTTLYAKWSKGGYFNSFDGASDRINSSGTTLIATDGHHFATDSRFASDFTANPAEGYISLIPKLGGTNGTTADHRLTFAPQSQLDISSTNKVILGFRTNYAGALKFDFWYATKDADGNWIAKGNVDGGADYVANHFGGSVTTNGDTSKVFEYAVDMSQRPLWDGFLDHVRIGNPDAAFVGSTMYYEYIKIVGPQTVEKFELTVEKPVAAEVAYGTEAVTAGSDKFIVTDIEWVGSELLGGMYFDSAKQYTARVYIEAADGYAISGAPHTITVNGEEAALAMIDGACYVQYTFDATEDMGTLELVDVTLHEENDEGAETEVKKVFSGRDVDLSIITPANIPTGMRWIGWSATEGGEVVENVNITEPKEYYAIYEAIDEYDFSNKYHQNVNNVKATDGLVSFDGAWTVVTPKTDKSNAVLTLDGMYVASGSYDSVEVIYNGSLEDADNNNKFSNTLVPALKVYGTDSDSYEAVLVKAEDIVVNRKVSYKYTYDITVNGKPNVITAIELAPYEGKPAWAVASAKLIENVPIEDAVVITGVKAPETWLMPDVSVEASENYEIESIKWKGVNGLDSDFNDDGSYAPESVYIATIVVKPVKGYSIVVEDATVVDSGDGAVDSAVLGDDGKLTITKTYPATLPLVEFEMSVADVTISKPNATAQLVAQFSPAIDVQKVTWALDHGDNEREIATIDEQTGVVQALYNGTVKVVATSVYNPEVTAEATITIENQVEYYTVTFDANTDSTEVTNMPEEDHVKLDYVLPGDSPVRPGFSFAGWAKSPEDTVTIARDYVIKDTTYYAVWVQGYHYEFFDQNEAKINRIANVSDENYDYNNGVLSLKAKGRADSGGMDMQFWMQNSDSSPLFNGGDYTKVVMRIKGEKTSNSSHRLYFASKDASGKDLATVGSVYANTSGAIGPDGYTDLVFDMSGIGAWTGGNITVLRIDPLENATKDFVGTGFEIDYIRAVSYEAGVIEVTGVDTPVAGAESDKTAVSKDTSKYVVYGDVTWEGELIGGRYFDGLKEYTACVTVKGAPGYFVSDAPAKATVNGKEATSYEYDAETGTLTIKYKFAATGALEDSTAYTVNLYGMDENGEYVKEDDVIILAGRKFELGSYMPENVPAGKRWIGWSEAEGATANTAASVITVNADVTYYAVFEDLIEFDYSNPYHQVGTEAMGGATLTFEDGLAIVTPASKTGDATLVTPEINIDGSDFAFVEVYYSALIDSTHGGIEYDNIFSATLKPVLGFSLTDAPDVFVNQGTVVNSERVLVGSKLFQKYTYDMTTAAEWCGDIAKLGLDPYDGYPIWGVGLIKLIPSEEISTVAEFEVDAPEAWATPAASDDISVNSKYSIISAEWSPAVSVFAASTSYTLNITYRPVAGYKVIAPAATFNGEELEVVDNGDDTYSISYTFTETDSLKETKVEITGDNKINSKGRYLQLKGETVAIDGSALPVTDVTWEVVEGTTYAKFPKADNGRLYPICNGTVVVKATSVYDPSVSATHEVVITNQAELVKVTFNKNTSDEVNGVPEEPVYAYGAFVPDDFITGSITRDGYYLTGWSVDEDALAPDESFNITQDTVLYAKWGKGYEWSFDKNSAEYTFDTLLKSSKSEQQTKLTVDEAAGVGIYEYHHTNGGQIAAKKNLLTNNYSIPTAEMSKLQMKLSMPVTSNFTIFYAYSDTAGQFAINGVERKYVTPAVSKNNPGEYQTVTFDLSGSSLWETGKYLNDIRLDVSNSGSDLTFYFDAIRVVNENMVVKFKGNGGSIPYKGSEVDDYSYPCKTGTIPLPADPVREGYDFLGWAKSTENYNKLYNNKFTVTDDVTLYAIWGPEGSADEMGSSEDSYSSSTNVTTSKGGQTTEHPGHNTYPALGGGSVTSNPSIVNKTPADKKTNVPERPVDDSAEATTGSSKFAFSKNYDGRFVDVNTSNWFYSDVEKSFRLGLMNGTGDTTFNPNGTVTLAEAITVAARMNAIYNEKTIATTSGGAWYKPYVDYATSNSIITVSQFSDYTALATREQVALLFVRALPSSWYEQKNLFLTIPDVPSSSSSFLSIQKLYNAGVITGVDAAYNFKPTENIKRSELSAIINRVALTSSRLRVITEDEKNNKVKMFDVNAIMKTESISIRNCVESTFKEKDGFLYAEPSKADPYIVGLADLFGGLIDTKEYKKFTFVIKCEQTGVTGRAQLFFSADGSYSESMAVNTNVPEANAEGIMTFEFDMSTNAAWTGTMTTLRFDPYNNAAPFSLISVTAAP